MLLDKPYNLMPRKCICMLCVGGTERFFPFMTKSHAKTGVYDEKFVTTMLNIKYNLLKVLLYDEKVVSLQRQNIGLIKSIKQ